MIRQLLIIRTHSSDGSLKYLLDRVSGVARLDIVVAADERHSKLSQTVDFPVVSMTDESVGALGLLYNGNWAWKCGDYALYHARASFPDYHFYWIIEPDAFIHTRDLDEFFTSLGIENLDFVATHLEEADDSWMPYAGAKRLFDRVYRCLFPFAGFSGKAIDHLLEKRRALSEEWKHSKGKPPTFQAFPNDESFVASCLLNAKFNCADLNSLGRDYYFREKENLPNFNYGAPIAEEMITSRPPDDRIYHPVFPTESFAEVLLTRQRIAAGKTHRVLEKSLMESVLGIGNFVEPQAGIDTSKLLNVGLHCLVQASRHPELFQRAEEIVRALFGKVPDKALSHYPIMAATEEGFTATRSTDFAVGRELKVNCFPRNAATAYSADYESGMVNFVTCSPEHKLLAEPFFYVAQRNWAETRIDVPIEALQGIYPDISNSEMEPLFIFSMGRCGSTLLSKLISVSERPVISEMDTFSPAKDSEKLGVEASSQLRPSVEAVLRASVLSCSELTGHVPDALTFKLKTQANTSVEHIISAFPKARYVFIFRRLEPWVRSFAETFDHNEQQICLTLKNAVDAYATLRKSDVSLSTLWYENMVKDPASTFKSLVCPTTCLDQETLDAIHLIMKGDSQAGSNISQENRRSNTNFSLAAFKKRRRVERTVSRFRPLWQSLRPIELLEDLSLPY